MYVPDQIRSANFPFLVFLIVVIMVSVVIIIRGSIDTTPTPDPRSERWMSECDNQYTCTKGNESMDSRASEYHPSQDETRCLSQL